MNAVKKKQIKKDWRTFLKARRFIAEGRDDRWMQEDCEGDGPSQMKCTDCGWKGSSDKAIQVCSERGPDPMDDSELQFHCPLCARRLCCDSEYDWDGIGWSPDRSYYNGPGSEIASQEPSGLDS